MPLFEYLCRDCGKQSELLVTGSEKPVCPHCGSKQLTKQFSTFQASVSSDSSFPSSSCASGVCPPTGPSCSTGQCPFG